MRSFPRSWPPLAAIVRTSCCAVIIAESGTEMVDGTRCQGVPFTQKQFSGVHLPYATHTGQDLNPMWYVHTSKPPRIGTIDAHTTFRTSKKFMSVRGSMKWPPTPPPAAAPLAEPATSSPSPLRVEAVEGCRVRCASWLRWEMELDCLEKPEDCRLAGRGKSQHNTAQHNTTQHKSRRVRVSQGFWQRESRLVEFKQTES